MNSWKIAAITLVLLTWNAATATARPHDRTGFFIGFGLGGGIATWDWAFPSEDSPNETSGAANFRIGGAVREDVVLGLETSAWAKDYNIELGGVDVGDAKATFSAAVFAATWFPGNRGFFVRGGVGVATAKGEVNLDVPGVEFVGTLENTDQGVAVLAATGYEWRLSDKFAIGPQGELVFLGVGGDVFDNVVVANAALQFNWYW